MDFIKECTEIISYVYETLENDNKWETQYDEYAVKIQKNAAYFKENKKNFNEWAPLFYYLTIGNAKDKNNISIRFQGQRVADLNPSNDKITISTHNYQRDNKKYFNCGIELKEENWLSEESSNFRSHFRSNLSPEKPYSKINEHRIEELLVTEFRKKASVDKQLTQIQPVLMYDFARFQMLTPLSASTKGKIKFSRKGGGIDILARLGRNSLCIIEVKDSNIKSEPPITAVMQGLIYAAFMMKLLRSKSGNTWWNLFGFSSVVPEKLTLTVASAMPVSEENDLSFIGKELTMGNDTFSFQSISFHENQNILTDLQASWNK